MCAHSDDADQIGAKRENGENGEKEKTGQRKREKTNGRKRVSLEKTEKTGENGRKRVSLNWEKTGQPELSDFSESLGSPVAP